NALKAIFEQYGEILDISVRNTLRMRGQAFVVFKEQESAVNAVKGVQGFALHGKPMSDVIAMLDGTIEEHKRLRLEAKAKHNNNFRHLLEKRAKEPPVKKFKPSNVSQFQLGPSNVPGVPATGNIPDEYLPPNNILFLQNLPGDITGAALTALFEQYGIAFVEYDSEPQAMIAKEALTNHPISPDNKLKITYAKK
ncbi:14268_t:CDS:2, partial [Racocetra fulgida]